MMDKSMINKSRSLVKGKLISVFMLRVGLSFLSVPWALAELPTGATVRAGDVSITPLMGNQLVINQNSPKAVIDWQAFSISRGNTVRFVITDTVNEMPATYVGLLPDLFKEGKGVVAQGKLGEDGLFVASEVLAKHDENYMPPEAQHAMDQAAAAKAAKSVKGNP